MKTFYITLNVEVCVEPWVSDKKINRIKGALEHIDFFNDVVRSLLQDEVDSDDVWVEGVTVKESTLSVDYNEDESE
jgi:hypothetical protein